MAVDKEMLKDVRGEIVKTGPSWKTVISRDFKTNRLAFTSVITTTSILEVLGERHLPSAATLIKLMTPTRQSKLATGTVRKNQTVTISGGIISDVTDSNATPPCDMFVYVVDGIFNSAFTLNVMRAVLRF
ncbi:hypothetical protein E4U21_006896 [Claviceps maximensis]|nr:hypothetical protein E4U21_006896 [Claviceps maximensis]